MSFVMPILNFILYLLENTFINEIFLCLAFFLILTIIWDIFYHLIFIGNNL